MIIVIWQQYFEHATARPTKSLEIHPNLRSDNAILG